MLKKLAIIIVCVGLIGVLFALNPPTYDKVQNSLESLSSSTSMVVDNFSAMGSMFTVVRGRLTLDPTTDTLAVNKTTTLDGEPALSYSWIRWTDYDNGEFEVLENELFTFKTFDGRDDAYNVMRLVFSVPTFDIDNFFGDTLNVISNILVLVATLAGIGYCFIYLFVDVISVTFKLVWVALRIVGFF